MMVVGDSITQGSSGDYTWRYRLYQSLRGQGIAPDLVGPYNDLYDNVASQWDCDHSYVDAGFDQAHDALWGRSLKDEKDVIQSKVAQFHPDYLLVGLGINDLAWGVSDAAGTQASLETFIANARAANPSVKIILGQVLPTERAQNDPDFAAMVADYNGRLATTANSMSTPASPVVVARTAADFVAPEDTYDGTHPNAIGEVKIAAAYQDALSASFGVGASSTRPYPTVPTGPRTPPALDVTGGPGTAVLHWTSSPGATAYTVDLKRSDWSGWQTLDQASPGADTSRTLELPAGRTYDVRLQTAKGQDEGVFSNVGSLTVPAGSPGPTGLTVQDGDGEATLRWSADPNASSYWVYQRDVTAGESQFTRLPFPVSGTSWTGGLLQNGGTYEFKLQSTTAADGAGFSNVVTAHPAGTTPSTVTDLRATAGNAEATLTWTPIANATGYYVWQRNVTDGDDSFTKLPYPVPGPSWTAGLLLNGATYQFKLQPVNGLQTGTLSAAVSVTPTVADPAAPTNVSADAGNGQVKLTWAPGARAQGVYVWVRNVTDSGSWDRLPYPVSGSSWTDRGLENGVNYAFKLQSVNGLIEGGTSSVVEARPSVAPPGAPTGLAARAGDHKAVLSWTPSADATGYWVWTRNVTAGESFRKLPYPVSGSSWTAGLLQNGAKYEFKLQSVNGRIDGATTSVASVTPTGPAPAAPVLTVSSGNRQATLSWTQPDNLTSVFVFVKNVTAGETTFTKLPYPVSGGAWTAGGLVNGATYQFQVRAYNDLIAGGTSNAVTAKPTGPTTSGPESLTITPGNHMAELTWTKSSGATGYYVWVSSSTLGQGWTRLPYAVSGTSWTSTGLLNGASYTYKLQSVDGLQAGGYSNAVTLTPRGPTPAAPDDLTANASWKGTLTIDWTSLPSATGYYVWLADTTKGESLTRLPYPLTGGPWTDSPVIPGHTYKVQLQAVSDYQVGGRSNTVTITVPKPPRPDAVLADGSTPTQIKLTWDPVPGADGYMVYTGTTSADSSTVPALDRLPYMVTGRSFVDHPFAGGGKHCYAITAVKYGVEGPRSPVEMGWSCEVPKFTNPAWSSAQSKYLTSSSSGAVKASVMRVDGGADTGIVLARAFIRDTDAESSIFTDRNEFSSQFPKPSRATIAWDQGSGRVGMYIQPTCPFGHLCRDAMPIQRTTGSISPAHECGNAVTCHADTYSYNTVSLSGGGSSIALNFQLVDSYTSIPGSGFAVPGAIDGRLSLTGNGSRFTGSLTSDKYPSWDFVKIPRWTDDGVWSSTRIGWLNQEPSPYYLCTSCHGQRTYSGIGSENVVTSK